MKYLVITTCLLMLMISTSVSSFGKNKSIEETRCPMDTVGYAVTPSQTVAVINLCDSLENARCLENERLHPVMSKRELIAAVCPHDDYLYAAPVYFHVMREITAPVILMIGVSHRARHMGIEGKLIFDDFKTWKGPYGKVKVSSLRDDIIEALPPEIVIVDGDIHAEEHSLEAFLPFLQYPGFPDRNKALERRNYSFPRIIPILVTRFKGESQGKAAGRLASVLKKEMEERGWILGEDLQILISADCVHYGDKKWGGRNFAPFGTDDQGYEKALKQEMKVIDSSLTGVIDDKRINRFRSLVERDDPEFPYKIPWCGVYSIPFGLSTARRLCELVGREPPEGFLLKYQTSLEPGRINPEPDGLGVTNINTLHHWVGYAAVGYW
ncbi:MAG: AmmeMemoRadiSam system protein B [Candidatus Krumholzibacteriota bacterium]|nr:AmmeMemoRadiSam system protein B [Candidatus Krumholzibacteriota bacterium]